jgi:4'-phosphopantetheinyl transferase
VSTAIDVYWDRIDADEAVIDRLQSLLAPDECAQAAYFRRDEDRRRYVVRHGRLRLLLAQYLDRAPAEIRFGRNEFGKPAPIGSEIRFSLSHSRDVALYAVARGCEIGCDLEWRDPGFAYAPVADSLFSRDERATLRALPPERRRAAFFRCWTRKEAYVKARGQGLSWPLDRLDVLAEAADESAPVQCDGWAIRSLHVLPGYEAAVSAAGIAWSVCVQRLMVPDGWVPA